ncbi:MAG TPA: HAD family hydrolase [Candidatus Limnocylindria bacterium]|jgi:HAD superfamily hydrolase (TIGR01662 family)|nr:HAD family hydrolase [Candidatus Limnocylindria bacterium]
MKSNGRPAAMLLDFGGVLVDVLRRPAGLREISLEVHELVRRERANSIGVDRIERDVRAGWKAYADWKNAEGRRRHPREIGHREFWEELVAADWPEPSRRVVGAHATALCERLDVATKDRPAKPDSREALATLAEQAIPVGIVSNAMCGAGSRALVRAHGFEPYVGAQIYSDEAGVRKPNPEIFRRAAAALGVDVERCWYVGDTIDRDVLGGRRAGVAKVILLPSGQTRSGNDAVAQPDIVIERPSDLLAMLAGARAR